MSSGDATNPEPLVSPTELWADFTKLADAQGRAFMDCFGMFRDPRTLRKEWLEALSQAMDVYLRSPAFLEAMRINLEILTDVKTIQDQSVRNLAHQFGVPLAGDIHELSDRLRRLEGSLSARLDAIEDHLENIKTRDDGQGPD